MTEAVSYYSDMGLVQRQFLRMAPSKPLQKHINGALTLYNVCGRRCSSRVVRSSNLSTRAELGRGAARTLKHAARNEGFFRGY